MYYHFLIKLLAQKTVAISGDSAVQNAYQFKCKKKQLSAFLHGLRPKYIYCSTITSP